MNIDVFIRRADEFTQAFGHALGIKDDESMRVEVDQFFRGCSYGEKLDMLWQGAPLGRRFGKQLKKDRITHSP